MSGEQSTLGSGAVGDAWPSLPLEAWQETCATLHMWTQIVGKIRLGLTPLVNHWWNSTLYVTRRGLATSAIPYGAETFEITFDFHAHQLAIETSRGDARTFSLASRSVADFYRTITGSLAELGIEVAIRTLPMEVENPIPFEQDEAHAAYDPEYAWRFWRALVQADRVMNRFRASFIGKASPVHFFWGSFDLAVTRFSGRPAPPHPGVPNAPDRVTREAYSHELSSCGFWPGNAAFPTPIFYAYAYPAPPGFKESAVRPGEARYSTDLGEFILPYEAVRSAAAPDEALLAFLQSTYEAAADRGHWDRQALERPLPP